VVKLAELQQTFASLATGSRQPSAELLGFIAEAPGAAASVRVRIYAENLRVKNTDCLGAAYKRLARLLGPTLFQELADAYVRAFQRPRRTIEDLVNGLPAFLALDAGRWGRPDVSDLAALELARNEVAGETTGNPPGPEALAALAPDEWPATRLRFIAALRLLRLRFDVGSLWTCLDQKVEPPPPAAGPQPVLVWREGHTVFHSVLSAEEADALERARAGQTLAEVCEAFAAKEFPADAACGALAGWFEDRLVLSLATDCGGEP
jgi:hypothetical protein